jgi:Family of unknown function (DUF5681)
MWNKCAARQRYSRANGREKHPDQTASQTSIYEVGYCKPPVQHRFAKGQSGNPKGGSRKRKDDAHEEKIKSLIIDEAYREVALREGNNVVKLPVMQAVIRQLALAAAKGQPRSQRMLADLVRWVEGDRRELKLEYLKTMIEYKTHWEEKLERRKRQGLTGPAAQGQFRTRAYRQGT